MYAENPLLSDQLRAHHAKVLEDIAAPGDFYDAADRLEMVRCAREALACQLCNERKAALSPNAVSGEHDGPGNLSRVVVDVIHRIRTDPGRITKSWFDQVTSTLSKPQYIEIVSVVASTVIIDTLHNSLGLGVPALPSGTSGKPRGQYNEEAVEDGAWVPLLQVPSLSPPQESEPPATTDQPQTWNITRALGLVPSALELFFTTFRPHYSLQDIQLSISQGQAEFVAARVSAINECFY